MDELKLLAEMIAGLPQIALWVFVGFFVYKVVVIGSIFGIARLVIIKAHDWLTNPPTKIFKLGNISINQGVADDLMTQIHRLKSGIYIRQSGVDHLKKALDAAASATAPVMSSRDIPAIGAYWSGQGGINGGLVRGRDAGPDYYIIVAEEENHDTKRQALKWAEKLTADGHKDFTLPYRAEQAILFGNVPELFKKEYYWSREPHDEVTDYQWCQSFDGGYRSDYRASDSLRARAVRRLAI